MSRMPDLSPRKNYQVTLECVTETAAGSVLPVACRWTLREHTLPPHSCYTYAVCPASLREIASYAPQAWEGLGKVQALMCTRNMFGGTLTGSPALQSLYPRA